jgi:drug/metabolite transporter (DMT)-like permease
MSHRRAVALMVLVTRRWSIAGVVTRHLDSARAFEVTFWRSAFNAIALALLLLWWRGPWLLAHALRRGGRTLWLSGVCWAVMFTAFMVALTLTTVANVLVTMASAPLLTALVARIALGHRLPARTWFAIVAAGAGIAWMFGAEAGGGDPGHFAGVLVAFCVPIASAVNWTLIQHNARGSGRTQDLLPAVLVGAVLSAAVALPVAMPLSATPHDMGLLALLGVVQLAIPCLIAVTLAQALSAPEISLLALLEVIFGVAWAWLGANEAPSAAVLGGGALVLGALALNEALGLKPTGAAGAGATRPAA